MERIACEMRVLDKRLLEKDEYLPTYAKPLDAGMDLRACIDEDLVLPPGANKLIPSGIAIHLNRADYFLALVPRSGLGHKFLISLANAPAVIDGSYTGQIMISVFNQSPVYIPGPDGQPVYNKAAEYTIKPMERIAQMVACRIGQLDLVSVDEFTIEGERGATGFGSSGRI